MSRAFALRSAGHVTWLTDCTTARTYISAHGQICACRFFALRICFLLVGMKDLPTVFHQTSWLDLDKLTSEWLL